jgi:hypothetical protein
VAFFRFEHQIRPEHVLLSAAGHDSDDDDFMPFSNARSSSLIDIDKSKDIGPRKTRQTRACTEVYTIYLLLHFHFIRVTILKLLFLWIASLFFPSIYHKSTLTSLLPNLYFSISLLLFDYPCIFFSITLPLHWLIISTSLSPIISFYLKSIFVSTTHASVYHFYSVSQNFERLFFFIQFITLLFLKFLLFLTGNTKQKETYQPFLHCKCLVQS